jgi:hypothetical protein
MKDKTLKLSGHAKDRFLERFFAADPGLSPDDVVRLAERSKVTFASLRVRKIEVYPARTARKSKTSKGQVGGPSATAADVTGDVVTAAPAGGRFDAYAFGLVPTFQREGREGLIARLGSVGDVDHLRQMAKAQQIVLPQELRTGSHPLETVRGAIADAVAKRIADRRAAAG